MRPKAARPPLLSSLALLLLTTLAACEVPAETNPDNKYACQTEHCVCEPEELTLFNRGETVPILWRENGEAYCPEGHVLKREKDRQ